MIESVKLYYQFCNPGMNACGENKCCLVLKSRVKLSDPILIILYDNCCDATMKYCENSYIYTNDKALNTRWEIYEGYHSPIVLITYPYADQKLQLNLEWP